MTDKYGHYIGGEIGSYMERHGIGSRSELGEHLRNTTREERVSELGAVNAKKMQWMY